MFKTIKADWYFIIPMALIWLSGLAVTAWDFVKVQEAVYHFALMNAVGLIFIVVGIVIRRWAKKTLGKYFSYGLKTAEKQSLVRHSIYKHIRHPAYSGNLLIWFGVPLLFSSLYGLLIMLLLIPPFLYRIRIEENMLIAKFGNKYLEYRKASKKLLPNIY